VDYSPDIGLYHLDRARVSCRHQTPFCNRHCYMKKLYALQSPELFRAVQARLEREWQEMTPERFGSLLRRRKHPLQRFRFASQGEMFSTPLDVAKVASIIEAFPGILFWAPTRAWRSPALRALISGRVMTLPNARILASLDPSNTSEEFRGLVSDGWSTTFFGIDDVDSLQQRLFYGWASGGYHCPKTWQKRKGSCAVCMGGCFSRDQVHVYLKRH